MLHNHVFCRKKKARIHVSLVWEHISINLLVMIKHNGIGIKVHNLLVR